jgi:hypothetical protein
MIIPFHDDGRDTTPEEIHRGGGTGRAAAEDNYGMPFLGHGQM